MAKDPLRELERLLRRLETSLSADWQPILKLMRFWLNKARQEAEGADRDV